MIAGTDVAVVFGPLLSESVSASLLACFGLGSPTNHCGDRQASVGF